MVGVNRAYDIVGIEGLEEGLETCNAARDDGKFKDCFGENASGLVSGSRI